MRTKARRAQSIGFLFGAKEAGRRRGVPRNQPKVSILVQQDQECQDGRMEVIDEPTGASRPEAFRRRRLLLSEYIVLLVPFQIRPLWDPFPLIFGKRTKATINRTSHHHRRGRREEGRREEERRENKENEHTPHQLKNTSPPEACSSTLLAHPQPFETIHQNAGVGYYTTRVDQTRIN